MIAITTFDATLHEGVVDLILAVENDEFGFSLSFADQPDLKNIQDSYVNAGGQFWIALDGSKVVGTTALYNLGNGDLALRKMFVLREFRGGQPSLAQRLLDEAFQWARAGEFKRIFLDTSSKFAAAIRLYGRNGFVEIGPHQLPAGFPVFRVAEHFYMRSLYESPPT